VRLSTLCGFGKVEDFQRAHCQWIKQALRGEMLKRDERWSGAIAVGSQTFVEKIKRQLDITLRYREIEANGTYALRESRSAYTASLDTKTDTLRLENTLYWTENSIFANTWRGPTQITGGE